MSARRGLPELIFPWRGALQCAGPQVLRQVRDSPALSHLSSTSEFIAMLRITKRNVLNLILDESGPTAVEYAIMLALILAVCIAAIATMGIASNDSWTDSSTKIDGAFNTN